MAKVDNKQLKLTDAPTYDFMVVIGMQFSDDTMFGKSRWKMLKNFAMLDNYKEQAFHKKLSEPEKYQLELIRMEQKIAGNKAKLTANCEKRALKGDTLKQLKDEAELRFGDTLSKKQFDFALYAQGTEFAIKDEFAFQFAVKADGDNKVHTVYVRNLTANKQNQEENN